MDTTPDASDQRSRQVPGRAVRPWLGHFVRADIALVLFVLAALVFKLKLMRPAATGWIVLEVVQHDAIIFALLLLLCAVGLEVVRRWSGLAAVTISRVCIAAGLTVAISYTLDVFAYYFFNTRLYASDIVTFSSELRSVYSLLRTGWLIAGSIPAWKLGIATVIGLVALYTCWLLLGHAARQPGRSRSLAAGTFLLMAFYELPCPGYVYTFADKPLFENFIEVNANFFFQSNFSDGFRARLQAEGPPAEVCRPGRHRRLNVVVVIVESLSAYHSKYFSGVEDWTPRLDEIARRETSLTNFHANGWTTIGGLISLLGRTFPFVPEKTEFNKWGSPRLTDFMDLPRPLARMLSDQGYRTVFISGGDLAFLGQGDWLRAQGFQRLVGHKDPRFDKQKIRGPFDSVPDRLLYAVSLEELAEMPANGPYFAVIQTYWSHRPFMTPEGAEVNGEEPVIRETDAQIGTLYERLMAAGFFENGLLFIVGDHRAMEPFRKEEFTRFGASAITRIPAVIVTRAVSLPKVLSQDFQQRDLGASIEALVGEQYCTGPQEGAFLADPPTPGRCIMHGQADDRDVIFVKCGSREGTIAVAGDRTRVVNGQVDDETSAIQTVNVTRMRPSKAAPHP
jgi:phosphoglycerol transferase MdoB-like AlkP superfamily enzyme